MYRTREKTNSRTLAVAKELRVNAVTGQTENSSIKRRYAMIAFLEKNYVE